MSLLSLNGPTVSLSCCSYHAGFLKTCLQFIFIFCAIFIWLAAFISAHPCWDSNLITVCMSFTQLPSLIFVYSSKVFSQSFCQSAFPGKCHRALALQQCIIYFLTARVTVNTILYVQLIFLNSSLFTYSYFCASICLLPHGCSCTQPWQYMSSSCPNYYFNKICVAEIPLCLIHTVVFILLPWNLMYMLNLATFQLFHLFCPLVLLLQIDAV